MKIWIHWYNDDGSMQEMRFQSISRGMRWRRKTLVLKRGYKAVKKYADLTGPAELSQAIKFYKAWVKIAAGFSNKYCGRYVPRDLKDHFLEALDWLSNHQEGEI